MIEWICRFVEEGYCKKLFFFYVILLMGLMIGNYLSFGSSIRGNIVFPLAVLITLIIFYMVRVLRVMFTRND